MIVEMRKLNLVAMSYDRSAVLRALQETNAVEIKTHTEQEGSAPLPAEDEKLREYLGELENALNMLVSEADNYAKEHKCKTVFPKDGFEISYTEFLSAPEYKDKAEETAARVNALVAEKNELKAQLTKTERVLKTADDYACVYLPFSSFADSAHTKTKLGAIPASRWESVQERLDGLELTDYRCLKKTSESVTIAVTAHKSAAEWEDVLQSAGFVPCPFTEEQTGAELYASLQKERDTVLSEISDRENQLFSLADDIRMLKIYCDYLAIELEKAESVQKMRGTERTFLLEAYVPSNAEERVRAALSAVSGAVYLEFSDPSADEEVPTLMKNNAVVENFETITNMYSPPSRREFDPNTIMAFFYSLFLGFIMADIGYGLVMLLGGGFIWYKNRAKKSGLKSLAGVFAIGGIFAIFWGILFNSLCGIAVLPFTVMPDAQTAMWTFIGISIPSVLIVALVIGVVQLMAGYLCRFVQCARWGRVWDGVFDGLVWAVFSLGAGLAIVGLVEEFALSFLAKIGGIAAACALLIAVLTAGRKEKLLGKFTKGFGALYSVINYASDILSYARLYGLMLSGAVIAQIISQYAVQFITTSVPLAIIGVILMIVGHVFNLAISLLGAYIHDARLQYVEFYGRFYEGEGELFAPLGSKHKYVWVAPPQEERLPHKGVAAQTA